MSNLANQLVPPALRESLDELPGIWLVGGALRDHFLQRPHPDLDFAVAGDAAEAARTVADRLEGHYFTLDDERDAGRVILPDQHTLDFIRLRGDTIEADLGLRDFTINAMAAPLRGEPELVDPLGGLQDLRDRRLRPCSPTALSDDPIRVMRAIRLAHEIQLHMPGETAAQVRAAAGSLAAASAERVRDELARMLDPRAVGALQLADQLGVLGVVLPELEAEPELARRALRNVGSLAELLSPFSAGPVQENLVQAQLGLALGRYRAQLTEHLRSRLTGGRSAAQMLMLAGLYWAVPEAAASVRRRARALRFSRHESALAAATVSNADPRQLSELAGPVDRYRLVEAAGRAAVEAVLLSLALYLAEHDGPPLQGEWERHTQGARSVLELVLEREALPEPLVDGDQLMRATGLGPGPQIGRLLRQIREAQIAGQIDSPEAAFDLARTLLAQD